jgi:adenylate cyclase
MQEALREFNRVRESAGAEEIHIGIGINTGPVIAGAIGSSRTLQYTVIGDAVNVASRLCNLAKSGEVLISETTMALTRDRVQVEERESVQVTGKSNALAIFSVQGIEAPAPTASRSTQSFPTNR